MTQDFHTDNQICQCLAVDPVLLQALTLASGCLVCAGAALLSHALHWLREQLQLMKRTQYEILVE